MCWPRILAAAVSMVAWLALPGVAHAASPQDRVDPCARAGRDSCGTTGVGFYRTANYGLRWFGDYRGAVAGRAHTFCLDLRYWYASPAYRYRRQAGPLRNREGDQVPAERERRIAYAIWRYGRSSRPAQQAAVMLYVHAMMGDARAGEADPAAVGTDVLPLYRQIARDSARFHGPYRVRVQLPPRLLVDRQAEGTVEVRSAGGAPLPDVSLTLAVEGATGAPTRIRTNAAGLARLRLTPASIDGLRLRIRTEQLAAPHLQVFAPTAATARVNGQRLAAPAADAVTATVDRDVQASPRVVTRASARQTTPGGAVHDTVSVGGIGTSSVAIHVELFGPYPTRSAISCSTAPYWTGTVTARGDGSFPTPAVRLERAGYYAFLETITARPAIDGLVTPCGDVAETTVVRARPTLETVAARRVVRPGSRVADRVRVHGLGSTPAAIEVELFGPFASRSAIRCTYAHLRRSDRMTVGGDGEARSPAVTVARAGLYAFRERLLGTPLIAGTTTPCNVIAETTLAAPLVVTGRGDHAAYAAARAGGGAPTRVEIPSLGIAAPISPAGIDLGHGVLGVPADIHRVGWWRDGAAPGSRHGTVLLAGHRDSAREGDGAFFGLATAKPGMEVVVTARGRSYAYRVATVESYPKEKLPLGVFDTGGRGRLVLVTCGGRFDAATGHYPDNVVVTAVPRR